MSDEVNKEDEQVKDQSEDSSSKGESDTNGNQSLASSHSEDRGSSDNDQNQQGLNPISPEPSSESSSNTDECDSNGFVEKYRTIEEGLAEDLYKICWDGECKIKWHVENCLESSRKQTYEKFVGKYSEANGKISILFLGMNPSYNEHNAIPFNYASKEGTVIDVARQDPLKPKNNKNAKFWRFVGNEFGSLTAFFETCVIRNFCPISFAVGFDSSDSNSSSSDSDGVDNIVDNLKNMALNDLPSTLSKNLDKKCRFSLKEFINKLFPSTPLKIVTFGDYVTKQAEIVVKDINENRKADPHIVGPFKVMHPAARKSYDSWLSTLTDHTRVIDDIRKKKYDDFVTKQLGDKSIQEVPGIDYDYVAAFPKKKAKDVVDKFISIYKNEDVFKKWLTETSKMKTENAQRCYDAIKHWVDKNPNYEAEHRKELRDSTSLTSKES